MKDHKFKILFYTVSLSWGVFFALNLLPNSNQRYYPVPLIDVRIAEEGIEGIRNFVVLPSSGELRNRGVENIYITQVPVSTYRPIYGPLLFTALCLVVSILPNKVKYPKEWKEDTESCGS